MAQVLLKTQTTNLDTFRTMLQHALEAKQQRNTRYSLRAFARDLEISPSFLSEVLNGKYGVSKQLANHISKRLGFEAYQASVVELELCKSQDELESKIDEVSSQIRNLIRDSRDSTYKLHIHTNITSFKA